MTPANRAIIGVDESGKGDFFGPLVIAAFLAPDTERQRLLEIGVRDGKLLSDKRIIAIDSQLRRDHAHAVLVIDPVSYNKRYARIRNLNKLLAEGHASVIDEILEKNDAQGVVLDKFGKSELVERALATCGRSISLVQLVRGERIVQVAAASILARAAFVREMGKLSDEYGVDIPKGAAPKVDRAGRDIVDLHGAGVLSRLAKTHFKNYQRIVNPTLFSR